MDLQQIGAGHPQIKRVLDLIRNATPNRSRFFVAEGLWATNAVLDTGVDVELFLWCPEAAYSDEARLRAEQMVERAYRSYRVSEKTLARMAEREKPDGLLAIARQPRWQPDELTLGERALVLVTDGVEIPGNLGTLIRTLDACRADCLILTNRRTRITHPKVFRGSHGMSLRVPSLEFDEPTEAIEWLKRHEFGVYLADTAGATHYRQAAYRERTALVLGSERYGISKPWYGHDFARVFVPMLGAADSLNVAISASVLLYEVRARQDGW